MGKKWFSGIKTGVLILLTGMSAVVNAQISVQGKVADESGMPLPGVSIAVEGTTKGTYSDIDGNYTMNGLNTGDVLVFTFVGYLTEKVVVENETTINVTLMEDVTELDEVVIIGYGVQKESDKTGSISTVTAKDFTQGSITSPQELVVGKIAGVQITSAGGEPGSGSTIRVRGGSSLEGSNNPLIVIDGIPLDDVANDDIAGMRNPLNMINPNDIESFTVLKDASATAIYGSRASNGVIIITTKKGSQDKQSITYTGTVSLNTVGKTAGVLDAESYRQTMEENYPLLSSKMGTASTDWFDEIFNNSWSTTHNLSMSGSVKNTIPYRLSVGYNNDNGILINTKHERITTGLNLNPQFFDEHLKVNIATKYANVNNQFSNNDAIGSAMTIDPTQTPYDPQQYEEFGGYFAWTSNKGEIITTAPSNPVAQLEQKTNKATVHKFIGNIQLDYKVHFLPDLRININAGKDYSESDGRESIDSMAAWDIEAFKNGGDMHIYKQKKYNDLLETYLDYNVDLTSVRSELRIMAGHSWQHFWQEDINHTYFLNPESEDKRDRSPYNIDRHELFLESYYARLNYSLMDRYKLTTTLRADGSSRFSQDNRWSLFPSIAFAWNIDKESFMINLPAINELKLRFGYGTTGQQEINDYYPAFGTYVTSQTTASYVYYEKTDSSYNRIETLTLRPNRYTPTLKWEETETYNIGIDFALYKNRFTGSIEAYLRNTNDLLSEIDVPAMSNFSNRAFENIGSTENKGIELELTANIISKSDLTWRLSVNGAYNQREITQLTATQDSNFIGILKGGIEGGTGNNIQILRLGYEPFSFFVWEQVYENGVPIEGEYVDKTGDGLIREADLRPYKSKSPDFMCGFASQVYYQNWEFTMSGHGSFGNYVYNNVAANTAYTDRLQTNGQFISNIGTDIYNTGFQEVQYFSDYYVQNASFFRFDHIQLGYNLEQFINYDMKMKIFATVNNVYTITSYNGVDPEIESGIDSKLYPRPRIFLLGISMTF